MADGHKSETLRPSQGSGQPVGTAVRDDETVGDEAGQRPVPLLAVGPHARQLLCPGRTGPVAETAINSPRT